MSEVADFDDIAFEECDNCHRIMLECECESNPTEGMKDNG